MSKIAVVGGNAALAKYLMDRLAQEGNTVVTVGRSNCDILYDLRQSHTNLHFPEGIESVVHVAAGFNEKSDDEMCEIETVNALGTLNVCIAAKQAGIGHVILISSISASLNEDSFYHNMYAISKKHSEELASYYCKNNAMRLSILRPSQIYDDKGLFRKHQPLLYLMADKAQNNQNIIIFGRHDAIRNYIYIDDLVEIIQRAIRLKYQGIFHCVNPNVHLSDLASAAISAFNSSGSIEYLKEKSNISDNGFAMDASFYDLIQYTPQVDIVMGMKKIAMYRKNEE